MIVVRSRKVLALFAFLASCLTAAAAEDRASTSQPIVGGVPSDETGDAVVLVVHPLSNNRFAECSGTMLTPTLVLTARHCVVQTDDIVDCSDGGGEPSTPFDPSSILVFGGRTRPTSADIPSAPRGTQLFFEPSPSLCDDDLALVLLDGPVANATIAPVRLDSPPQRDELVTIVGWGSTGVNTLPSVKQQRAGVSVLDVGSAEFLVGPGPCEGDSGGPAIAASGAVIGVLSRGSVEGCTQGTSVYTATSSFRSLILSAYQTAGQAPWLEGQPNPLLAEAGAEAATSAASNSSGNHGGCAIGHRTSSDASILVSCAFGFVLFMRRSGARERRACAIRDACRSSSCKSRISFDRSCSRRRSRARPWAAPSTRSRRPSDTCR